MRILSWSAIAPFAGALPWRNAGLLTGDSAWGKSQVIDHIVRPIASPSFFNGGKYEFTEDTYTEHVEYWLSDTTTTYIGRSFTFESKIEGDQWTISGPIETTGESLPPWKGHEVFKRSD